jgi:CubicO group peptidase (beta-lactamase class C family)
MLISGQLLPTAADAAPRREFSNNLTRAIAIAGREEQRFRLHDRMAHYLVPGLSVAVVDKCRIVDARGFGGAGSDGGALTPRTLFQAGSISKTFTAVAALRLVDEGALSLDDDVRPKLASWRLPDTPLLQGRSVTLRGLLSHTAGINQEGGIGYARGAPLPTLIEILEGRPPANTSPIRVEHAPGSRWRYSGGGYYITQALMSDTTRAKFPQLMNRLVFEPLRLKDSVFSQPLEQQRIPFAARAVGPDGSPLEGGWRVNPELAAGGLWTTPSDIARLLIGVSRSVRKESAFLSPALARELMTRGPGNWGLGVNLGLPGPARVLRHTGHTVGFVSEYVMYPDTCQGAVVMTNADQGGWLASEVLRAIGDSYGWPAQTPLPVQGAIPLTAAIQERFVGTYRLRDFPAEQFVISRKAGGLYWARLGHIGRDLLPESDGQLFSPDSRMTLKAVQPSEPIAQTLELSFAGGTNIAERVN